MNILLQESTRITAFAKTELEKYLTRMGYPDFSITLGVADLTAYGLEAPANPVLDDQYYIHVTEEGGCILGSNERSVLLGVYRYLTLIGCAFLRPGTQHEIVPVKTKLKDFTAEEAHAASLRHRGVCLEGACSIDTILEFIDYLPKAGYNSFFLQFKYPYTFLERYYSHRSNPLMPSQPWTMKDSERIMEAFDEAQQSRGLLQHRVGHGWTSAALGCEATGWDSEEKDFTDEVRARIAMLNGKRELFYGVPTNTNLCLSNPDARKAYADAVIDYAKENPSCNYLHLWLADGTNNSCECENCRKAKDGRDLRPSDHYVTLMNEIDARLTDMGSDMKLVMLVYLDLLWAPLMNTIQNPDRFVLMFAPISRSFESSFADVKELPEAPEFKLNHLQYPHDVEYNLRFLKDWQDMTHCSDCFDYDYYMGRAHYSDPTYVNLSRIIAGDMQNQKAFGINGINSCQELRAHSPNGLANHIMGLFSMNTELDFGTEAAAYYDNCYGADGGKVLDLLSRLSDCFRMDYVMRMQPAERPDLVELLKGTEPLLQEISALINDHAPVAYKAQEHMWQELQFTVDYTRVYAKMVTLRLTGRQEEAAKVFEEEYMPLCRMHELKDESLDLYRIDEIVRRAITGPQASFVV
ncbi:MAG: DUF4838 domain-containing protein [Lachnospiraceae bacterium]|nr:DUF4838 domain-containing protein [Lachnospiraceae bacterium]